MVTSRPHPCASWPSDTCFLHPQVLSTDQYSFLCGNETIFDQATLTCNYPVDSLPCEDAEAMYSLKNDEFFKKLDGSEA